MSSWLVIQGACVQWLSISRRVLRGPNFREQMMLATPTHALALCSKIAQSPQVFRGAALAERTAAQQPHERRLYGVSCVGRANRAHPQAVFIFQLVVCHVRLVNPQKCSIILFLLFFIHTGNAIEIYHNLVQNFSAGELLVIRGQAQKWPRENPHVRIRIRTGEPKDEPSENRSRGGLNSPATTLNFAMESTINRENDAAESTHDDRCDADNGPPSPVEQPALLPVLSNQAATARESDFAREKRLHQLHGGDPLPSTSDRIVERLRIRYAPASIDDNSIHRRNPVGVTLPSLTSTSTINTTRDADSTERLRVLRAMETELTTKQRTTASYFTSLYALQQQSTSGSMKALLQQIVNVLFRATYSVTTTLDTANNNAAEEFEPHTVEKLAGHEFFSLYTHAQQTLECVGSKKQRLEMKLEMERALEDELGAVLHQLDLDLHVIRTQHLENHERVEAERMAVHQLEDEYAALTQQEQELRKECDGLSQQAERQRVQLAELQNKSAYLDFISRIPLKKHLEQKKLKDQDEALLSVVRQDELENQRLERELAKLNEQIVTLEHQFVDDVAHKQLLESELLDAQQLYEATQIDCQRMRDCHTPRPSWDAIIERIPELSTNENVEWDERQTALSNSSALMLRRAEAASKIDGTCRDKQPICEDEEGGEGDDDDDDDEEEEDHAKDEAVGGKTQELVKEVLQWIERLQKHCGVNLHLSRIWHDVEEARVELNIVQHQLEQAVRKHSRYPRQAAGAPSATAKQKPKQKPEYICALGVHEEIPLFLRHQGKVKRHALKKGELESLIRKVWVEKRQREKRNPHLRLPLEDVLYEKLHRKYGFQPLIAEWGYNVLLALDKFAWDAEIELFLLCLTQAISDQVFVDQEQMLDKCTSLLLKLSESYQNESFVSERRVLLKDALVALRKFFPLKTSIQLHALEKAMIRDMHKMKRGGNDSILYIDDILAIGVQYPRGFFVKALRSQHFKEIQDYYVSLNAELAKRDEHKTGELPLYQVLEAMLGVDPLADQSAVYSALMRAFGVKTRAQLEMHEVIYYKAIVRKMNATGLLKFALNYDPNAENHWPRHGTIDLSFVSGNAKPHNSLSARQSFMLAKAKSIRDGLPIEFSIA